LTVTLVYEVGFVYGWKTVNNDPGLGVSTPTICNDQSNSSLFTMWHPSVSNFTSIANNCAGISGGVFHARESNALSTGWSTKDDAVMQQGSFTWQRECNHVDGAAPNWSCERNTYGLAYPYISDYDARLTVTNITLLSSSGIGDYNIFLGFYYWLPSPVTCHGASQQWLEFQVRLAFVRSGTRMPVGTTDTWYPGDDCGYAYTVTSLSAGGSVSLNSFDLRSFYQGGLSTLGLPSNTRAVLAGIEVGTEGWGVSIPTDFTGITVQAFEPNSLGADVDFDGAVTSSDLALVQSFFGQCPSFGTYQWRVDTNATNPCIDSNDVAFAKSFVGATIPGMVVPASLLSIVVGSDGVLYWSQFKNNVWASWASLGVLSPSPPALCAAGGGRVDLVVRGSNNGILHTIFQGISWSGIWDSPGGATRDRPSCAILAGVLYLVVRGLDNRTWSDSMALGTNQWSGWTSLGGLTPSQPSLVATPPTNRLDVVVRGMNNEVYHIAFVNGTWSPWEALGGATLLAPAIVSDGNSVHLVVQGLDSTLYYNNLVFGGSWRGWSSVGGSTTSTPALTVDIFGRVQLVVRGLDGSIYHTSLTTSGWNPWDSPGGATPDSPGLAMLGSALDLIVRGGDSALYFTTYNSPSWSVWMVLPASTIAPPVLASIA
jgi:hypothetical protein